MHPSIVFARTLGNGDSKCFAAPINVRRSSPGSSYFRREISDSRKPLSDVAKGDEEEFLARQLISEFRPHTPSSNSTDDHYGGTNDPPMKRPSFGHSMGGSGPDGRVPMQREKESMKLPPASSMILAPRRRCTPPPLISVKSSAVGRRPGSIRLFDSNVREDATIQSSKFVPRHRAICMYAY